MTGASVRRVTVGCRQCSVFGSPFRSRSFVPVNTGAGGWRAFRQQGIALKRLDLTAAGWSSRCRWWRPRIWLSADGRRNGSKTSSSGNDTPPEDSRRTPAPPEGRCRRRSRAAQSAPDGPESQPPALKRAARRSAKAVGGLTNPSSHRRGQTCSPCIAPSRAPKTTPRWQLSPPRLVFTTRACSGSS